MAKTPKNVIRTSLQQAKLILLAKSAEQSGDAALGWTQAESESATMRTAHALGENAPPSRILAERARTVLSALSSRGVNTTVGTQAKLPTFFAPIFILAAFLLGALTDRIASPEHLVNLLSPPYWTIIIWNLLVYLTLFLCMVGVLGERENRFSLPFRNFLATLVEKAAFTALKKGFKSTFYATWAKLCVPLVRMHVARTLHLAAVFFALGIIVSLLVRGIGTSYWAGWESTWLSEEPQTVKNFLDFTYGLIPAIGGLPQMPDLDTVVNLRADRLPYLDAPVSAAPWLVRMMIIMAVTVIVPRLALILFDTWRMKRFTRSVTLNLDEDYYRDILSKCAEDASLGRLGIVTNSVERPARIQTLKFVTRLWGTDADSEILTIDFNDPESASPAVVAGERHPVMLLWFDGMETPEEDTHGLAAQKLKTACTAPTETPAVLAALLDLTEFSERFASVPERIKERESSWREFAKANELELFVVTDRNESGLTAVKALRAWASTRSQIALETNKPSAFVADVPQSQTEQPQPS